MKIPVIAWFVFLFTSCTKSSGPTPNTNKVNATVLLTSGSTVTINATAAKAVMGCSLGGGGSYVAGTGNTNAAVYISFAGGTNCVTSPGTYNLSCEYRADVSSSSTPIYQNTGVSNPGNITFTAVTSHYMEGFFSAICKLNTVSVFVNGTFNGSY